MIASWICL